MSLFVTFWSHFWKKPFGGVSPSIAGCLHEATGGYQKVPAGTLVEGVMRGFIGNVTICHLLTAVLEKSISGSPESAASPGLVRIGLEIRAVMSLVKWLKVERRGLRFGLDWGASLSGMSVSLYEWFMVDC